MFFSSKKSFITSGLLDDATDIHSHILPGIDDGVSDYKGAIQSLRWLKSIGVGCVYLTPHVMSDLSENTSDYLLDRFDLFTKQIENEEITDIPDLRIGAEYMLELPLKKQIKSGLLTYADRHVLVETSYFMPSIGLFELIMELMESDYTPILAHPERYHYMEGKDYEDVKSRGIKYQLNFLSLIGSYGTHAKEKSIQLLTDDMYDYAGSDFHNIYRHRDAFEAEKLTKKQIAKLAVLFQNNTRLW